MRSSPEVWHAAVSEFDLGADVDDPIGGRWCASRVRSNLHLGAVTEHEAVVRDRPVQVLFEDFGDSALIFEVLFWIEMFRPMDRRKLLSDLRYRIDELFREHHITIAFPQRDVHIGTPHPLQVRVVRDEV